MADLENLLLEAAGRTGNSRNLSRSQARQRPYGSSYPDDGSDSGDQDSDDQDFASRKTSGSRFPLKKRFDPSDADGGVDEEVWDDNVDPENSDFDSEISVGSDLYKDEEDKERLSKMSELDRELILAERSERRTDYRLKESVHKRAATQETPPPRISRSASKFEKGAAKDGALNELRAKRKRQQDSNDSRKLWDSVVGSEVTGTGGAYGSSLDRNFPPTSPADSSSSDGISRKYLTHAASAKDNRLIDSDEDDSYMDPVTFDDIKEITIRRSKLSKWSMEPFFEELIVGCFVRVGIGMSSLGQSIYRLCIVKNVDATNPNRLYKLENKTTFKYLNCIWGNESSAARWQMARVSDSAPLEDEYKALIREVEREGGFIPRHEDVLKKIEAIQKANNFVYDAAAVKQMLQEKKLVSSKPLNIAAEKDRLRKEMKVAESLGDESEVERVQKRLKELADISSQVKSKDAKAVRLSEMNRKNRAENFKNASERKPVNAGLKAGEAGYDPFSRRWTRSRNYYLSKPGGGEGDLKTKKGDAVEEVDNAKNSQPSDKPHAGEMATAAALEAAAGAGKLIDTSAPVDHGTVSNMLHNFDLPISLTQLQKLGGPQGVRAGFMMRKQKIEATIGREVPEDDGRQHLLTLTISDYKRRRGLLEV